MNEELIDKLAEHIRTQLPEEDIIEVEQFGDNVKHLIMDSAMMGAILETMLDLNPITAHANSLVKGMWMYREILDKIDPAAVVAVDAYLKAEALKADKE